MTIKCQVCGTENDDSNKYCDGCGVELTPAAAPAAPAATAAETTPTLSAPVSEVTPPAEAASVPAPEALNSDAPSPAASSPEAAAHSEPSPTETSASTTGTIGNGEPNPYQTPMSETALGQADSPAPAAPVTEPPLEPVPPAAPETPAAATTETPVVAAAPVSTPETSAAPTSDAPAKLGLKKFGQPTGEFIPLNGEKLIVGRFDASSGPVDIDLGELVGKEHISRHHAELYRQAGVWYVRDLGSTNGVFLKKKGESTFSPRLQEPAALADGDELAFGNIMLNFHQG